MSRIRRRVCAVTERRFQANIVEPRVKIKLDFVPNCSAIHILYESRSFEHKKPSTRFRRNSIINVNVMYRRTKYTLYRSRITVRQNISVYYIALYLYIMFVQAFYALDLTIFTDSVLRLSPAQTQTPLCIRGPLK